MQIGDLRVFQQTVEVRISHDFDMNLGRATRRCRITPHDTAWTRGSSERQLATPSRAARRDAERRVGGCSRT
jgi:hypothetical protein